MKQEPVVVIADTIYRKARKVFDGATGFKLVVSEATEEALAGIVERENAFCVVIDARKYTGPLYKKMSPGGLIARFGVGYDGVDMVQASACGLVVTNTPGVLDSTVAESTVFLAAEVLRKFGAADGDMKQGRWQSFMGNDLKGKTWSIIGMGRIGRTLCQMLVRGFGVRVYGLKSDLSDAEALKASCGATMISSDFADLAPQSDIVSLHLPASAETRHFMNEKRMGQLKRGAILINTGRGSLVDEHALFDSLVTGQLGGAGLDVFETEPYHPLDPAKDLRSLSGVTLIPHLSSSTVECAVRMAERVIRNIRFALEKKYDRMDLVTG